MHRRRFSAAGVGPLAATALLLVVSPEHGWAAPSQLDGFPAFAGGVNRSDGLVVVDLDGDDELEIVATSDDGVTVVHKDAGVRKGFPVTLRGPTDKLSLDFPGPPAVCDLSGDGTREIIVAASDKRLHAIDRKGKTVPGFPVALGGPPGGPVSCVPRSAGGHDLTLTTKSGRLLLISASGGKPATVAKIGDGSESGVAVADLDADGSPELVAGGGDSKLYAVSLRGRAQPGFPYKMSFRTSGVPAVGDIDDDGRPEIVVGSQDFKIHAVDIEGKAVRGFPVATGYRIYGGVALADLNADGVLDVVVGSGDGKIYACDGRGKSLPGFPVKVDGRVVTSCAVGDLDRDGRPEVAAVTQAGTLHVLTARGKKLAGFPVSIGGKLKIAPAMGDLDADRLPELLAQGADGRIRVYKASPANTARVALLAWPMAGHDAAHTGRFGPNPGRFKALSLKTPDPATADALRPTYRYFDLDGDPEKNTQIRWYLDGKHQPDLDNQTQIPPSRTRKHERWSYTLQEGGNHAAYGETDALTRTFEAPQVEIRNTPPTAPKISLGPESPSTVAELAVAIAADSSDVDGDKVLYRYAWTKDGATQPLKNTITRVAPQMTRKNERWRVVVTPFDGEVEGQSAEAALRIRNTPPGKPAISVTPSPTKTEQTVRVAIAKPAPDDDGDPIRYEYRFWVNGVPLYLPLARASVPPRSLFKHTKVRIEVTAVDDEQSGGRVEAELQVDNTEPPAPKIAIWPTEPRTADGLTLAVLSQTPDADGDAISLRHRWFLNGAPVEQATVVPSTATKKGQKWRVEVTPFDGEVAGKPVVAENVILNTPPQPPLMALDTYEVYTDQAVEPRVLKPATDADGDAITLRYAWIRNGQAVKTFAPTKAVLTPQDTTKGSRWVVRVTPVDDEAAGKTVELAFAVLNSAPSAAKLALSHPEPTVRDKVTVSIAAPATDKDNDPLTYHYRWLCDGKLQKQWPLTKRSLDVGETRKGQHWRVEVRAHDGQEEGAVAIAELRVRNHAPDPPKVALKPLKPRTTDPLRCELSSPSVDADNDSLKHRYRWFANGKPVTLSPDLATLPPSLTRKTQTWGCEVQAFDGDLLSKAVRSGNVAVANSPPAAATVRVVPENASTEDDLLCQLDEPARDADFDTTTYSYAWRVNGMQWRRPRKTSGSSAKGGEGTRSTPNHVPSSVTRRGQVWECAVVAHDGEIPGALARAERKVLNSPPSVPEVRLRPEKPVPDSRLTCTVLTESTDIDKDRINYLFEWYHNGHKQAVSSSAATLNGGSVKPGKWHCRVTATDGVGQSEPVSSQSVVVPRSARPWMQRQSGS